MPGKAEASSAAVTMRMDSEYERNAGKAGNLTPPTWQRAAPAELLLTTPTTTTAAATFLCKSSWNDGCVRKK